MAAKRKNLKKKIASLSALGAGALVFAAGKGEASVIYSGPLEAHVGFGPGGVDVYSSPDLGPAGAYFSFLRTSTSSHSPSGSSSVNIRAVIAWGCGCFSFAANSQGLQFVGKNAVWTPLMTGYSSGPVGGRIWAHFGASGPGSFPATYAALLPYGQSSFSDLYSLFRFHAGPDTFYGWIHLSFAVTPAFGPDAAFGPDLIIHDWAYEDSGQRLAAGQVGVPEPATIASTGLAALALGAVGLRRWRKMRQAA